MAYIVRSAHNPNMILCTNGQFYAASMVGPGGYHAKLYKTKSGAEKSCHDKPVMVELIS